MFERKNKIKANIFMRKHFHLKEKNSLFQFIGFLFRKICEKWDHGQVLDSVNWLFFNGKATCLSRIKMLSRSLSESSNQIETTKTYKFIGETRCFSFHEVENGFSWAGEQKHQQIFQIISFSEANLFLLAMNTKGFVIANFKANSFSFSAFDSLMTSSLWAKNFRPRNSSHKQKYIFQHKHVGFIVTSALRKMNGNIFGIWLVLRTFPTKKNSVVNGI